MRGHIVVGHVAAAAAYPSGASQQGIGSVRDTVRIFWGVAERPVNLPV